MSIKEPLENEYWFCELTFYRDVAKPEISKSNSSVGSMPLEKY